MKYYISKKIKAPFDKAVERTVMALKNEGFVVISEINIDEKFKSSLQIDFRRYKILGACNPSFAYQALLKEDKIGTMLPCNVIIQELQEGLVEVATIDPFAAMQSIENEELNEIAKYIKNQLQKVIENVY